jgi:hypothetical protein
VVDDEEGIQEYRKPIAPWSLSTCGYVQDESGGGVRSVDALRCPADALLSGEHDGQQRGE